MAAFSTVHGARAGGISPITSSGERLVPWSMRSTRGAVGGTTGSPSVQPRSNICSSSSSGNSTATVRDSRPVSAVPRLKLLRHARTRPTASRSRVARRADPPPSSLTPVRFCHSPRCHPMTRSVSWPFSRRTRVGTISTPSSNEPSSARSSTTGKSLRKSRDRPDSSPGRACRARRARGRPVRSARRSGSPV